jgi:hypothetical protein
MTGEGRQVADQLGLDGRLSLEQELRLRGAMPVAMGLERLRTAGSLRAAMGLLWRELVPSVTWLRWRYPDARPGPLGTATAYVRRWAWLTGRLPSAMRALMDAHRARREGERR